MQVRRGRTSWSVALQTTKRGRPVGWPTWVLRYRTPTRPGGTDKALGKAWVDRVTWRTKHEAKELRSTPEAGYLSREEAHAAAQAFLATEAPECLDNAEMTVRALCNSYLAGLERKKRRGSTISGYRGICNQLCTIKDPSGRQWGDRSLQSFSPDEILQVREEMEDRCLSNATLNQWRTVIRGALGVNHITEVWEFELIVREAEGELHFYEQDELAALMEAAKDDLDHAIFTVAAEAGLRQSEIRGLPVGNVDFTAGRIRITQAYTTQGGMAGPKSRRVRSIPMTANVRQALQPLCKGRRRHELVFSETDQPICGHALYKRFQKAAKEAGLPILRFHDLRHSFGTAMIRKFHPRKVQEWMGHADLKTTLIYMHHSDASDDAEKMSSLFTSQAETPDNVVVLRQAS